MMSASRTVPQDRRRQNVVVWKDLRRVPVMGAERVATRPLLWDEERSFKEVLGCIPFEDERSAHCLFDALVLHSRGSFEEAHAIAGQLMHQVDPVVAMPARVIHLRSALILGYTDTAYDDSVILRDACDEGFAHKEDKRLYGASAMCGGFLEYILRASLFDLPTADWYIEAVPFKVRATYFYTWALKEIMLGNYEYAQGIAHMARSLVSNYLPDTHTFLNLSVAISCVARGEIEQATDAFMLAWAIYEEFGVVAPFIETYAEYYGLHRACIKPRLPEKYAKVEFLADRYRKATNDLCQRWGIGVPVATLSSSEYCVWMLVVLGWRNKEIASYLHVSENTVKHQLTSIYQKMGIDNRKELRQQVLC